MLQEKPLGVQFNSHFGQNQTFLLMLPMALSVQICLKKVDSVQRG
jgi:hypothetical protein